MNVADYTYLITNPDIKPENQIQALEMVLDEFPYFQSARAIQLKGLYNQNSFKYNAALKTTAAHSTDRSVLFDFITSDTFTSFDKNTYEKKLLETLTTKAIDTENSTEQLQQLQINKLEHFIPTSIEKVPLNKAENALETVEENLGIGKPLEFSKKEQHSFQEWLQLSKIKPIEREIGVLVEEPIIVIDEDKRKKIELIDKFIETSPKISPVKHGVPSTVTFDLNTTDNSYLMTETLARVYLEQKKYQKAIQAYEILILKYPEKSSFFADRISDIKILQHNNN